MENNVIYISDSESSNSGGNVNVATRPIAAIICACCCGAYLTLDAMKKHHRDMQSKKMTITLMGGSLSRDTQLHLPSSAPTRQMGVSPPQILRGGGLHRFIPYPRMESNLPLPDYIDDPSGMTLDLLSRLNFNPLGSVRNPKSPDCTIIDLDLKL